MALAAEHVIGRTPAAERLVAIHFYGEVIDLCQQPGLAQRARGCLAQATTLAAARACPSLPALGDGRRQTGRAPAPTCKEVVAHAMELLTRGPDAPDPAAMLEEERIFQRDCGASTPDGRRCAIRAPSVDALDECLSMLTGGEGDDDLDDLDDLDDPFGP